MVHDRKILPSMQRLVAYHQPKEDALRGAGCGPPPIIIKENFHLYLIGPQVYPPRLTDNLLVLGCRNQQTHR